MENKLRGKILFITEPENSKWILRRWCEEWVKNMPEDVMASISDTFLLGWDIYVYVNYALFKSDYKRMEPKAAHLAYFTHRENDERGRVFDHVAHVCDLCLAQSWETYNRLPDIVPKTLFRPSIDSQFKSKIKIGIVARHYDSGRKRTQWVPPLQRNFPDFEFIYTDGKVPFEQMPAFYKSVDYTLILADNEGGPMPVPESLAMGTPVIAPKGVGWCEEFPCIFYNNTLAGLGILLSNMVLKQDVWEKGAKSILELGEKIINDKNN